MPENEFSENKNKYSEGFFFNEHTFSKINLDYIRQRVYDLIYAKNPDKPQATELIVQFIKTQSLLKTTRKDERNEIWIYFDGIFNPEGKTYIQEITRAILRNAYTTFFVNQIISKIEADTFINPDEFFNNQNNFPLLIPIENGILNIKTRELKPFTSEIYFFNKLPLFYDPKLNCDKFIYFLNEILDNKEYENVIQEIFGYCLNKTQKHKKAFMLEGAGNNGKTQLLKILTEFFLGTNNYKQVSLNDIEKPGSFSLSLLQNALVNISSEISENAMNDTGKYKEIVGGDKITADIKFKNPVSFYCYAKMIFTCNDLPIPKDNSKGFWTRWIRIEFLKEFVTQNEYDKSEDKTNKGIANKHILDEIVNKEEMSGVLNWALDGFERLEKNKDFSYKSTVQETKFNWLKKANSVLPFIEEFFEEDYDCFVIKTEFKKKYIEYCKEHKLKIKSDAVIKKSIEDIGGFSDRKIVYDENGETLNKKNEKHVWSGIKFNNSKKINSAGSAGSAGGLNPKGKKDIFSIESKYHDGVDGVDGLINRENIKEETFTSLNPLSEQEIKEFINNSNNAKATIEEIYYEFNLYSKQKINDKLEKMCDDGDVFTPNVNIYMCL